MPFQSEKQRRWMWANNPALARKWSHEYGSTPEDEKPKKKKKKKRVMIRKRRSAGTSEQLS